MYLDNLHIRYIVYAINLKSIIFLINKTRGSIRLVVYLLRSKGV